MEDSPSEKDATLQKDPNSVEYYVNICATLNEFARSHNYPLDVLVQIKKNLVDIYFIAMDMTYTGTAIPTNGEFSVFNYEGLMKGTHNLLTGSKPKDEIVIEFTTVVRLTGFLVGPPTVGYTNAHRLNYSSVYYKDKSTEDWVFLYQMKDIKNGTDQLFMFPTPLYTKSVKWVHGEIASQYCLGLGKLRFYCQDISKLDLETSLKKDVRTIGGDWNI